MFKADLAGDGNSHATKEIMRWELTAGEINYASGEYNLNGDSCLIHCSICSMKSLFFHRCAVCAAYHRSVGMMSVDTSAVRLWRVDSDPVKNFHPFGCA